MVESKIDLTHRLRREGRWPVASKWKDDKLRELRAGGMKRGDAGAEAWRLMELEFPPLPAVLEPNPAPLEESEASAESESMGSMSPLPESWGDLPEAAPLDVEVEWVHQNRVLVVEDRPGGKSLLHWERARKAAPSYGAVNLMEFAATNRKGFVDILQRVKPGDGGEEESIRREKTSIEEIRKILADLRGAVR